MRVALYTRVSTSEQATEGNSLDAQLAALRTYAKLHNWEIWEEYVDGGFGGGTDERPALQRLMHDAIEKKFDILIVAKLDRFFRNLKHLVNYISQLDSLGIGFISTQEGLDTSNPMGKFTLNILGVIAEFERGRIGERVRDARKVLVERHQWSSGKTPFGFRFDKQNKQLEIYQPEAEVVEFMFNHYLNDSLSVKRLADLLNTEKKTTPRLIHRTHNLWTQSAVYPILTHGAYKGGPNEVWEFKCPAIVEPSTWTLVQTRLRTARHFKETTIKREFQGLLRCGLCGRTLHVSYNHSDTTVPIYSCPGRKSNSHLNGSLKCDLPRFNASTLDKSLSKQVTEVFSDPEIFKRYALETVENLEVEVKELERRLKPLQAENDRIKGDMAIADTMYKMRRLEPDEYRAMIAGLEIKLRAVERQQTAADPMLLKNYKEKLELISTVKRYISQGILPLAMKAFQVSDGVLTETLGTGLLNPQVQTSRKLMQRMGMEGYVFPDRIELKGSLQIGKPMSSDTAKSERYLLRLPDKCKMLLSSENVTLIVL
jgi:DNA invertase Pin-like site-specific DNA recombinase